MVALSTLDWAGSVTADVITGRFVTGHVGQVDESHQKQNLFHLATCITKKKNNCVKCMCWCSYSHWRSQSFWENKLMNNIPYMALTVFYTTLYFSVTIVLCLILAMARFVKNSSINIIFVKFQRRKNIIAQFAWQRIQGNYLILASTKLYSSVLLDRLRPVIG